MRRARLLAAVTVGLTAVLGPAAPRPKDPSVPAGYFPTAVGTRWVYSTPTGDEVEVVSAAESKDGGTVVTVMREEAGERTGPVRRIVVRPDGLFLAEEDGSTYDPPVCMLKLPALAGDAWDTETGNQSLGRLRFPHKCIEVGELETAAGTFRAVRVQGGTVFENGGQGQPWVDWYAAGVGRVKHNDWILTSFTPGKK